MTKSASKDTLSLHETANLQGKEYFKRGLFDEAAQSFTKAFEQAYICKDAVAAGKYLNNRAACYSQLQQFENVLLDTDNALRLPLDHALRQKAMLRGVIARCELEIDLSQAEDTVNTLIQQEIVHNNTKSGLYAQAQRLKKRIKSIQTSYVGKEDDPSTKLIDNSQTSNISNSQQMEPFELVHDNHTWRLSIREGIDSIIEQNRWYPLSLYVSNEFGLFSRRHFNRSNYYVEADIWRLDPKLGIWKLCQEHNAPQLDIIPTKHTSGSIVGAAGGENVVHALETKVSELVIFYNGQSEKDETSTKKRVYLDDRGRCTCRLRISYPTSSSSGSTGKEERTLSSEHAPSSFDRSTRTQSMYQIVLYTKAEDQSDIRTVMPVASAPFYIVQKDDQHVVQPIKRLSGSCRMVGWIRSNIPSSTVDTNLTVVNLWEDPGDLGIGGRLWDSGTVLAWFLMECPDILLDSYILELGSGTGIAGIAAQQIARQLSTNSMSMLTDLPEVVQQLTYARELNQISDTQMTCTSLPWGSNLDTVYWNNKSTILQMPPSIVLMADVVYDLDYYEALYSTIQDLSKCNSPNMKWKLSTLYTQIITHEALSDSSKRNLEAYKGPMFVHAYRHRNQDAIQFWNLFAQQFDSVAFTLPSAKIDPPYLHCVQIPLNDVIQSTLISNHSLIKSQQAIVDACTSGLSQDVCIILSWPKVCEEQV